MGWNWFGWFPADAATDAARSADLVFWLRASRADTALEVRLSDHHKGSSALLNLKEKGILTALPTTWREVRVPLSAFGGGFDLAGPLGAGFRHIDSRRFDALGGRHHLRGLEFGRRCGCLFAKALRGSRDSRPRPRFAPNQPAHFWGLGRRTGEGKGLRRINNLHLIVVTSKYRLLFTLTMNGKNKWDKT